MNLINTITPSSLWSFLLLLSFFNDFKQTADKHKYHLRVNLGDIFPD